MKYYSVRDLSKLLGVTPQTLRNWDKTGKLKPHHVVESGYRYYSEEQVNRILGVKDVNGKVIGCCRVSSSKQKDDLGRQIESMQTYLLVKGRPFGIITVFSCRLQGKRANKAKKLIKELVEDDKK